MPKLESIAIYHVAMPLVTPFNTAFGDHESIESVLVRVRSGELEGWGEAAPWGVPAYSPEWSAGVFLLLRDVLGPRLLGQSIESGEQLQQQMAFVKGNPFAKSVIDLAWWDLEARRLERPLWQLLGGSGPEVEVGADFGVMQSIDALLEVIGAGVHAGFKRTKLKFRPGWELEMVAAVREAFPEHVFHVDCNSAYTLDDLPMLKQLDPFKLAMIEQPLAHDDLADHAALQRQIDTPVCLDESITSLSKAQKAIELGACRWINIKPGRVGGLTPAVAIHDHCARANVPCWIGGMLESAVGAAHCLALATLPNIRYPSDIFPSERFYREDISQPPITLSGPSMITAPTSPGIAAAPVPDQLAGATIQNATLE